MNIEYPILENEYPVHVYETGPDNNLSLMNSELECEKSLSRNAIKLASDNSELCRVRINWKNNHI